MFTVITGTNKYTANVLSTDVDINQITIENTLCSNIKYTVLVKTNSVVSTFGLKIKTFGIVCVMGRQ